MIAGHGIGAARPPISPGRGAYGGDPGLPPLTLPRRRALALAAAGGLGLAGCAAPSRLTGASAPTGRQRIALLYPEVPGPGQAIAAAVRGRLHAGGFGVDLVHWSEAAARGSLNPARHAAVILPDARVIPQEAVGPLLAYLLPAGGAQAGSLVALGGPFLSEPMQRSGRTWVTASAAQLQAAAGSSPVTTTAPARWAVSGATAGDRPRISGDQRDFSLEIPALTNWGNGQIPVHQPAFAPGNTLTRFAARGLGATRCFIVEWDETDGSRWIATVRVGAEWQGYALQPEDFVFWPDPPVRGRGGAGDRFHPAHATRLLIGVDTAHCGPVSGTQQVEVRDFGTSPAAPGAGTAATVPRLTGLWPMVANDADEAYLIADPVRLAPAASGFGDLKLPVLDNVVGVVSPVSRPRGLGWPGTNPGTLPASRFVPLVAAAGSDGTARGTPGAAILHGSGPAAGALWWTLGLQAAALAAHTDYVAEFALQAIRASLGHGLLWYGGAPASVTVGHTVQLGGRLLPGGGAGVGAAVTLLVDGQPTSAALRVPDSPGLHTVTVQTGGDRITCTLRVCATPPRRHQGAVTVAQGELLAGGGPWRPVGVNYWPRSTSGLPADLYQAGWLTPLLYDPDVVEADLSALEGLGCNYVAGIQYKGAEQAPALRDFLARCDSHGIRASIYVEGGNPLSPDPAQVQGLIEAADLSGDTAVCAYELAWEPHLGNADARRALTVAWQAWVTDQYGTMAKAQGFWGYAGGDGGPSDTQLSQDGPWAKMVAAYRRFVDDHITVGYGRTWAALRAMGDTHLLWTRTGYGGTGQMSVVAQMPFDLASGALYLDAIGPEGWGLGAGNAAAAGLTTAYGRTVGAGKPVLWMEFGTNIWADPESGRAAQGAAYTGILRMVEASGANGAAGWWFPGGLRVDEGSDFGVFEADGTPRPAALALSAAAKKLAGRATARQVDVWMDVDRDRYVTGYAGVWAAASAAYLAHTAAGHVPGVRLPGQGSTSQDAPLVAVGGGAYPGYGPLQALNGAFARVSVGGRPVGDGEQVPLGAVEVMAGNTAPATWSDDVRLAADLPDGSTLRTALGAPVPFLGFGTFAPLQLPSVAGDVQLRLEARGGVRFGPVFRLRVG